MRINRPVSHSTEPSTSPGRPGCRHGKERGYGHSRYSRATGESMSRQTATSARVLQSLDRRTTVLSESTSTGVDALEVESVGCSHPSDEAVLSLYDDGVVPSETQILGFPVHPCCSGRVATRWMFSTKWGPSEPGGHGSHGPFPPRRLSVRASPSSVSTSRARPPHIVVGGGLNRLTVEHVSVEGTGRAFDGGTVNQLTNSHDGGLKDRMSRAECHRERDVSRLRRLSVHAACSKECSGAATLPSCN